MRGGKFWWIKVGGEGWGLGTELRRDDGTEATENMYLINHNRNMSEKK